MPLKQCTTKQGQSGWKWGDAGHCYRSKKDAIKQAIAIVGPEKFKQEVGSLDGEVLEAMTDLAITQLPEPQITVRPTTPPTVQAYVFPKQDWDAIKARQWLTDNNHWADLATSVDAYTAPQIDRNKFDAASLKTVKLGPVYAVMGDLLESTAAKTALLDKLDRTVILGLRHNSTVLADEPAWGTINGALLPPVASVGGYPHHWVKNATRDPRGFVSGTLYLHQAGLRQAWGQANRDGAPDAVKAHLRRHLADIGAPDVATLAGLTPAELQLLDRRLIAANLLTPADLESSAVALLSRYL